MSNIVRLLSFKVESFAKIDKSNPVLIVWPENQNVSILTGDQAVGKTSVISAFSALCGSDIPVNAVNKTDKDRRATFEFEKNERKYRVNITKTRFEVEALMDEKWAKLSSPKTVLQDILGPVGISPMFLKSYDGKKQIEWLRSFYVLDKEQIEMETKIISEIKKTFTARTAAKKLGKTLGVTLSNDPFYTDRAKWEETFIKLEQIDKDGLIKIQKDYELYSKANNSIPVFEESIKNDKAEIEAIDLDIDELEKKIEVLKQKQADINTRIVATEERVEAGRKYLEDNKEVVTKYENIADTIREQSQLAQNKIQYERMLQTEVDKNNAESEYIRLDGRLTEYRKAKSEFIKTITPDVEGLEVCIPDDMIDESVEETEVEKDLRDGIYYNGQSVAELSESELWSFYLLLLRALNVNIVLIENISSLGSGAVEMLNYYASTGGYILASEMKREEKNLRVIITDKIC